MGEEKRFARLTRWDLIDHDCVFAFPSLAPAIANRVNDALHPSYTYRIPSKIEMPIESAPCGIGRGDVLEGVVGDHVDDRRDHAFAIARDTR